jgi:hypothetical protein
MRERRQPASKSLSPKIVVQYRQKSAKIYEIESEGAALEVRICCIDDTAATSAWQVGAQSRSEHTVPVEGRGRTPAEALGEVARAWNAHFPALTKFDWEAIARELHVVHAI